MLTNRKKHHSMVAVKSIFQLEKRGGDKKEIERLSKIRRSYYDQLETSDLMELEKLMPQEWKQ